MRVTRYIIFIEWLNLSFRKFQIMSYDREEFFGPETSIVRAEKIPTGNIFVSMALDFVSGVLVLSGDVTLVHDSKTWVTIM